MKAIISVFKKVAFLSVILFLTFNLTGLAYPVQANAPHPTWREITPRAGNIRVIVPISATMIYLGTNDGVFRHSGKGWVSASTGLGNLFITSLVVDPKNPVIIYASTMFENGGVYKSTDGGDHWALSASGLSGEVRTLAIDPKNGAVLYAQTASQIFKSTDSGSSWQLKSQGITGMGPNDGDLLSLRVAPTNSSVLYVSEITGHLYKTTNGGETWIQTAPLLGERAWTLTIDPTNPDTVYVGTFADGVYKTTDGGQTWIKRNEGMPNSGNGQMISSILIDPRNTNTLYGSMNGDGLYKTTDQGLHWVRLASVGMYNSPLTLAAHPTAADTLYAGYDGPGLYISSNGGMTWTDLNSGLSRVGLRSMVADPKEATVVYVGAGSAGLFKTNNRGLIWEPLNTGLEFADFPAIAVDPVNNHNIYIGGDGGGFYRSTDSGRTWTHVDIGPDVIEVYSLAVDPVSPNIVYAGAFDHGLFKSTDYGQSWAPTALQEISVIALAIDPIHPATIFAAADGVWKSTDGGAHFSEVIEGLTDMCANHLAVNPITPTTVYVQTCDQGLFKSTNGGGHWDLVTITGSPTQWVSAFALDPKQPNQLYASNGQHLYRSLDEGASWSLYEDGLPAPWQIDMLAVSPIGQGCVFAAGYYTPGMFSTCAPAPAIHKLSRTSATAGEDRFTLEVGGLGFTEEAAVRWQGASLQTTFVNDQTLTVSISDMQLASPGETQVDVVISVPGTDPSEPVTFTVLPTGAAAQSQIFLPLMSK